MQSSLMVKILQSQKRRTWLDNFSGPLPLGAKEPSNDLPPSHYWRARAMLTNPELWLEREAKIKARMGITEK